MSNLKPIQVCIAFVFLFLHVSFSFYDLTKTTLNYSRLPLGYALQHSPTVRIQVVQIFNMLTLNLIQVC